jgi:soluble lytic murein transglycosylase-like protein
MVKYATAQMLGYKGNPEGLMDPKTNAHFAALYLKYQYDRYGNYCHAIAAYNAGRYNESKVLPGYPRNLKYVNSVKKISTQRFSCDSIYKERSYAQNNGSRLRIQSAK